MGNRTAVSPAVESARIALRNFGIKRARLTHLSSRHNDVFRVVVPGGKSYTLRLQNNLKSRLLHQQRYARAVKVVETMLMLAPDLPELWREAALLHRELGNLRAAAEAFEQYIVRAPDGAARHQAAAILQQLRGQLH